MNIDELNFLKIAIEKHPTTGHTLEFLIKQDAIAVMIVDAEETKTLFVKQYRPGVGKEIYEIPAGLIDPGEDAKTTLYREIEEETGYIKENLSLLYSSPKPLTVSPGYTQEKLYLYIVKLKNNNIIPKELHLDSGEDLSNHWINLNEVEKFSSDMKTILAYNIYKNL